MGNRNRGAIIGNLGDGNASAFEKLRRQLARKDTDASRERLEAMAREVDADLADPEEFLMVQELAAA